MCNANEQTPQQRTHHVSFQPKSTEYIDVENMSSQYENFFFCVCDLFLIWLSTSFSAPLMSGRRRKKKLFFLLFFGGRPGDLSGARE